jgi:hypothetical protein
LIAFSSTGQLNSSAFGNNGIVESILNSMQQITLGTYTENGITHDQDYIVVSDGDSVSQYTASGALDTNFATAYDGSYSYFDDDDQLKGLAVESNGDILAESYLTSTDPPAQIFCINPAGSGLDTSFGNAQGSLVFPGVGQIDSMAVETDGSFVVDFEPYATGDEQYDGQFQIVRFSANGQPFGTNDTPQAPTAFGLDGFSYWSDGADGAPSLIGWTPTAMTALANGDIVAVGVNDLDNAGDPGIDLALARFVNGNPGYLATLPSPGTVTVLSSQNPALPEAPTTLTAAVNLTNDNVVLNWTEPTGGGTATGYRIEWSTDGTYWQQVATSTTTTADIPGVPTTASQNYYYRVDAYNAGGDSGYSNQAIAYTVPYVQTPAAATPNPVTGTTTSLSVLGAVNGGSESLLDYTWSVLSAPTGASASFSFASGVSNDSNAAKNATATFTAAGTYIFQAKIASGNSFVTSSVSVVVTPTLSYIVVAPSTATVNLAATQQFGATAEDQFHNNLSSQPSFTWSLASSSAGTISSSGLYTAPSASSGSVTVQATSGSITGTATITLAGIGITTPASASPNPVTGTTANLSVLGFLGNASQANIIYTWSVASAPTGGSASFSANGSTSANNTTATLTAAGNYTFLVTLTSGSFSTTSSVSVVVTETFSYISVTPSTPTVNLVAPLQFAATAQDQFHNDLSTQPSFTWTLASGSAGTISSSGLYTAPSVLSGSVTVQATSGSITGTATITLTDTGISITAPASASPNPVAGTTTVLSVAGALGDANASSIVYTWSVTSGIASNVSFNANNGTTAANLETATFSAAGNYTFLVALTSGSYAATSSVAVTVQQTLSRIAVTPSTTTVLPSGNLQFSATAYDQFGAPLGTQPAFTWSDSDPSIGTLSNAGLYTAGSTDGMDTILASAGGVDGSASLFVGPITPSNPLGAVATDSGDIELMWLNLPILDNGQKLEMSQDPTFSTGVTTFNPATATTNYGVSGLDPATTYYFELLPSAGSTVVGTASATTDSLPTDGDPTVPVAPVITQQATASQPSPTTVSLTMAASSSAGDPLSYSWQVESAPNDANAQDLTSGNQTATFTITQAGTYEFEGTATDDANGLSVPSVVSVNVAQVASNIVISPGGTAIIPYSSAQLSATELDQFNNPMQSQPSSFSWTLGDSTLGSISASGKFTASSNQGVEDVEATANGVTGTGEVLIGEAPAYTVTLTGPIYNFGNPSDLTGSLTLTNTGVVAASSPEQAVEEAVSGTVTVNGPYGHGTFTFPGTLGNNGFQILAGDGYDVPTGLVLNHQTGQYTGAIGLWDADVNRPADWEFDWNVTVTPMAPASIFAYRTGGNFGQLVSRDVQDNPNDYVILTDTDVIDPSTGVEMQQGYTKAPIANNSVYGVFGNAPDSDLAELVLTGLPADANNGTYSITLSDPTDVRLFESNGSKFYDNSITGSGPLTLNLANPSGYLAGLTSGNVDLWVEGLNSDPDFSMTINYSVNGTNVSTDSVHMDIVAITYVNQSGNTLDGVYSESETDLLAAAGEYFPGADVTSLVQDFNANLNSDEFQIVLQGLNQSNVQTFTEAGQTVTLQSGSSAPETPIELVDSEDGLDSSGDNSINQLTGATVVQDLASLDLQTSMDKLTTSLANNQVAANEDFFFDGTNNVFTDQTNVSEMSLEDTNQGPQAQAHYIAGTQDSATGADCFEIAYTAFQTLKTDVMNDPNRTIDIVGFSRGSAEAVEFSNLVENALAAGTLMTIAPDGAVTPVKASQLSIRFMGLYDLVTTIWADPGNSGALDETLPAGVGLVAHAVALSEEREDFEFTDLSQLNPNGDTLHQLGFRGVHSDIGGDAVAPNQPDQLTAVTLAWMNSQAGSVGWTLNTNNLTINGPGTIQGLTAAAYNALPVHQIYIITTILGVPIYYNLQYRNFETIDPLLQCWQPGPNPLDPMLNYVTVAYTAPPNNQFVNFQTFWNPNFPVLWGLLISTPTGATWQLGNGA